MQAVIEGLRTMTVWQFMVDIHGFLATLSLILIGMTLGLLSIVPAYPAHIKKIQILSMALFIDVLLTTLNGILVLIPYRRPGGPLTVIEASGSPWMHEVFLTHKELTVFMPWAICLGVAVVTRILGSRLAEPQYTPYRRLIMGSLIITTALLLSALTEAVFVTKFAHI